MRSGAPVLAGQFSPFVPIGVETTLTGYELAWKVAGADQYIVWNVDNAGNFVSNMTGVVSGASNTLESLENSFHQDLNGDGLIGVPSATMTLIESAGATNLTQVGNDYFFNPVAGGTGPELMRSGAPVLAGQFSPFVPIGVEKISTGYELAWKVAGADQYIVWNVDNSGNFVSNMTGVVSGASSTLESLETSFHEDLNGDGTVGIPAHTSASPQVASTAPAALLGGGDTFVFRSDLGGTGANNSPPPVQQVGQLLTSLFEHVSTEVQHIVTEVADLTDHHGGTAQGPLFDLLHGFIIH
jgi:serralysin